MSAETAAEDQHEGAGGASRGPTAEPERLAAEAAAVIAARSGIAQHELALVLGSGWGAAAERIGTTVAELPAAEVPGFHASGIPGHRGVLRSLRLPDGRHALLIGARTHLYEGRGVRAVVHGVRTAAALGATVVVLTNGAGGLDPAFEPGQPVLISDHINGTARSPLEGPRFVDLTGLYSPRLRAIAREIDPALAEGVYVQLPGPHYETPAEIRALRALGADLVGMSTVLEAIAARAAGLEVLGLSLVTNLAAGITGEPLSHDEVVAAGRAAETRLGALLAEIVHRS